MIEFRSRDITCNYWQMHKKERCLAKLFNKVWIHYSSHITINADFYSIPESFRTVHSFNDAQTRFPSLLRYFFRAVSEQVSNGFSLLLAIHSRFPLHTQFIINLQHGLNRSLPLCWRVVFKIKVPVCLQHNSSISKAPRNSSPVLKKLLIIPPKPCAVFH